MAVNGQIWATTSTNQVDLYTYYGGSSTHYVLQTLVYQGNPGSTPLWNGMPPGYFAACNFWVFGGGIWTISGATIAVADASGQMRSPSAPGGTFTGRSGTADEIACIASPGNTLAICLGGTSWQAIHL